MTKELPPLLVVDDERNMRLSLETVMADEGYETHKITLGMDLGRFYPRMIKKDRPTVMAMVRPKTPRRGFQTTIDAIAQIKQAMPETEIILFGDRFLRNHSIPFPYRDEGIVTDQDRLAVLYSESDVFIDGSDFQGFGRCGLEAMACGAACVLTEVGGVTEYARHNDNALLVPPKQPKALSGAALRILNDSKLKQALVQKGYETARRFCHKREARDTLVYFEQFSAR